MFLKLLKSYSVVILLNYFCLVLSNKVENPQVFIDNEEFKGSVIGKKFQESNVEYVAFRGIPYAKAPINERRFKVSNEVIYGLNKFSTNSFQDPEKLAKFDGVLDATYDGYECHSITAKNASEDCLNLNIYTKKVRFRMKSFKF